MERFYYRVLPTLGLISGAVAWVDELPAGFIVATPDSDGFMAAALRRRWWSLGGNLAVSLLRDPRRLAALWETLMIQDNRGSSQRGGKVGELLSFGVLPQYRNSGFARRTGLRIGQDLMQHATAQLHAQGTETIRALVDQDNLAVKLMYRSLGWEMTACEVPGWQTPQVEFTLYKRFGEQLSGPAEQTGTPPAAPAQQDAPL
jgi:ribosomal protein S18 acetylase RimI-like enzyme